MTNIFNKNQFPYACMPEGNKNQLKSKIVFNSRVKSTNKLILISQRIIKNEYEIKSALSLEWIDLLNNYKNTSIMPIFPNSNF